LLKIYILVNDVHLYQLKEQEPLIIQEQPLPIKLMAKNGFHFSKPFYIKNQSSENILIGIGCEADNGRFWGGITFSVLSFVIFWITGYHLLLLLANFPLIYIGYKFFLRHKVFITIEILKH